MHETYHIEKIPIIVSQTQYAAAVGAIVMIKKMKLKQSHNIYTIK